MDFGLDASHRPGMTAPDHSAPQQSEKSLREAGPDSFSG
jgi:hypothetical protein